MERFILFMEEDKDDRYLTEETMKELDIRFPVTYFSNTHQMFRYLSTGPLPSLILIDFNSSPENGIEVLKKLKLDPRYNVIPAVILCDNNFKEYKDACYAAGANSFIKKPATMEETQNKIGTFFKYWQEVAEI